MKKIIWVLLLLNITMFKIVFSNIPNAHSSYLLLVKKDTLNKHISDSLKNLLKKTGELDQKYRNEMEHIMTKKDIDSNQIQELFKTLSITDSLNADVISKMLDTFGWLGIDKIGYEGVHTVFLVIQHSKLELQKKYFPLLEEAVNRKELKSSSLALLVDRIAIKDGRKQIYGTQVLWDLKARTYKIAPIEDPDNLDKRRAEVGLGNISDYLMQCCSITWNVETYKKGNISTAY